MSFDGHFAIHVRRSIGVFLLMLEPACPPRFVSAKLSRRRVLGALAALPLASHLAARADDTSPIKIAQSIALSGPLGELGQTMHQGAKACFAAINAKGGVHGRAIELTVADDGYDVKRALANVNGFMEDRGNFALFNCMGTPMIEAMLPRVIETGIPFFAPFSGALSVRPKGVRNVFNIRASYADEAEQLVQHLTTIGIKRIAIAYQNNSFGKEVFTATQQALARHKLEAIMVATVENNSSDAAAAAKKIAQSEPEALLVGLAGKPTIDFVKASRLERKGMPLYALSIMGAAATIKTLGADATGMAISQIVPLPGNLVMPVVRDFQRAWKAAQSATGAITPGAGGLHQRTGLCRGAAPHRAQPHAQRFYRQHLGHQEPGPGWLQRGLQ